jgi:hypothetical protein
LAEAFESYIARSLAEEIDGAFLAMRPHEILSEQQREVPLASN